MANAFLCSYCPLLVEHNKGAASSYINQKTVFKAEIK